MVSSNKRFEEYVKRFGFKIQKVGFRPDILSVQYMNKHLFTIPSRMYTHYNPQYKDMAGLTHPDYYTCEEKAVAWNMKVKRSNFLEEDWELEQHFKKLYE